MELALPHVVVWTTGPGLGTDLVAGVTVGVLALPLDVPVASIPVSGLLLSLPIALRCLHRPAWRG